MHSVILGKIVVTLSPNNTLMSDELILGHSNKIHSSGHLLHLKGLPSETSRIIEAAHSESPTT